MITKQTILQWRTSYGLLNKTPEEAMNWWKTKSSGLAPVGVIAALSLCLDEIERLNLEIERLQKDSLS